MTDTIKTRNLRQHLNKDCVIFARIPKALRSEVRALAEQEDRNVSSIVRLALRQYILSRTQRRKLELTANGNS